MREVGRVTGSAARPGRAAGRGPGGFSLGGTAGPAPAGATAAVAPAGLGLLALQEGGDRAARDRAARQRAESILNELRGLQRDLLRGTLDPTRLDRVAVLETGEEGADPNLQQAVQAAVLRLRVELARRDRIGGVSVR